MLCDDNDDPFHKTTLPWTQPWRALWVSVKQGSLIHSCDYHPWMPNNKTVSPPHPSSKIKVEGNPENTKTHYDMHPISGNIASQEK